MVKVPRFAFEKFPAADSTLTTHMKSVGEAMAIGRNFTEALGKALRSLEDPKAPLQFDNKITESVDELLERAARPHDGRLNLVMQALRAGATPEQVHEATKIDPWFVDQLVLLLEIATSITSAPELTADLLRTAKRHGFSDAQIASLRHLSEDVVRGVRWALGIRPVYKTVDTCAAEFAARTPYHYSSYDLETEVALRDRPAVLILGSGPNRIGQGIEFDYSCVHAAMSLSSAGYETIMVNCNPETVSTDYDTADRLYFEPLTLEDVLEVVHAEQAVGPVAGVIVQLGGQTPLGLAQGLKDAGVPIVGTSPEAIHLAEERGAFGRVLAEADLPAPAGLARSFDEAKSIADDIGYPCWCGRPMCSVAAAWKSSTTNRPVGLHRTRHRGPRRPTRCLSTTSSTTRWRSTSTLSTTAPISTSAGNGAHRGGGDPLWRLGMRAAAITWARRSWTGFDARPRPSHAASGSWVDQYPVRSGRRHLVRAGGEPRARERCPSFPRRPRRHWQGGGPHHARCDGPAAAC